jgi:predicted transposase YbfD/YdcC
MDVSAAAGFLRFFNDLPDHRAGNKIHKLHDLLVIAVMAVICGADGWAQVAAFGRAKREWLGTFLELPGGIPSHETFGRFFARLEPAAFERCFLAWMSALVELSGGRLIAIDGKAIRRSFEHAWDKSGMAHLVSALVCQGGNRMVFGQVSVEDKSNEITAIPKLLELMDLAGAVVTIDAMGTQREVAKLVVDGGGDYLLPVKGNQETLHDKVKAMLDDAVTGPVKGLAVGYFKEVDDGHGRRETRETWVVDDTGWLPKALLGKWSGLATGSLMMTRRTRQDLADLTGKITVEDHYYISSLAGHDDAAAERMAGLARGHWAVENNLHWQLDVSFDEDQRRVRKGHGAENFSRLCRIALNLLKQDATVKLGIKSKRLVAGWDHNYLLQLIGL